MLRAADAAGSGGVVFAGRIGRSLQPQDGAILGRLALPRPLPVTDDPAAAGGNLSAAGFRTLATVVVTARTTPPLDWSVPTAVFFGNESAGLDPGLSAPLDGAVAIPMAGRAEC